MCIKQWFHVLHIDTNVPFFLFIPTGDELNHFLNENWKEVSEEISPLIKEVIKIIANTVINAYFYQIPLDEILSKWSYCRKEVEK